jgi:hypothetical protein
MTDWPGRLHGVPVFRTWMRRAAPSRARCSRARTFRHLLVTRETAARSSAASPRCRGEHGLWIAGMYAVDVDNHESALTSAVVVARALAPDSSTLRRLEDEAARSSEPLPQFLRRDRPEPARPRWTNWVGNQQARPEPHLRAADARRPRRGRAGRPRAGPADPRVRREPHLQRPRADRRLHDRRPADARVEVLHDHPAGPRVRMESGATVAEVDAALQARGLVIPTNVVLSSVRYGGLIATGCHGSGRHQPPLSDFVEAMEVVDGRGRHSNPLGRDDRPRGDGRRAPRLRPVRDPPFDHHARRADVQRPPRRPHARRHGRDDPRYQADRRQPRLLRPLLVPVQPRRLAQDLPAHRPPGHRGSAPGPGRARLPALEHAGRPAHVRLADPPPALHARDLPDARAVHPVARRDRAGARRHPLPDRDRADVRAQHGDRVRDRRRLR